MLTNEHDNRIKSPSNTAREDHRSRVGRERRQKMRAHLLDSVLAVCAGRKLTGATVIQDVVKHAGVSRGTFYKYFDTLDEAVTQLAFELAEEMTLNIADVYDVLHDPIMRTATGFQTFLCRAWIDANWGGFLTHLGLLNGENSGIIASKVRGDIRLGMENGDYRVASIDVAADLLMGAKHEAIRRIISGERELHYIRQMAAMVLRSFGVEPVRAEESAEMAFDRLVKEAPRKLNWWKDLE